MLGLALRVPEMEFCLFVEVVQGPHGLYDPKKARLVDCHQPMCAQVQQGGSYTCGGNVRQCDYDVEYADGSSTMGILVEDVITLFLTNGTKSQTRATIG